MPHVKEVVVKDWAGFEDEVTRILDGFTAGRASGKGYMSNPLFRGQADHRWMLETTLERFSARAWSVSRYYRLLLSIAPAVSSLTQRTWSLDPHLQIDESYHGAPPGYEFMIYLRHHGFPSPLLDWTRSPYVAAFFAFAPRPHSGSEAVAVYAFLEYVGRSKTWLEDGPRIIGLGPYAITHERHYAQQCEYTICKKKDGESYLYCNHEEALGSGEGVQDVLTKILIPTTERGQFLRRLESMNIHAYLLFRDETALMQMLAYQEIEKHDGL
jgi:hypothetical protein